MTIPVEVVEDERADGILAELIAIAPVIADLMAKLTTQRAKRLALWVEGRDLGIQQKTLADASGLTPTAVSQVLIRIDSQGGINA
jgi:hypothetical protein